VEIPKPDSRAGENVSVRISSGMVNVFTKATVSLFSDPLQKPPASPTLKPAAWPARIFPDPMNTCIRSLPSRWRLLAAALLSLPGLATHAQSTAPAEPETVVLPAFEVRSPMDSGYRVQNAVSTTGVAQALIDTPLPITVITNEFLQDAGLEGFGGALKYVSSVSFDAHTSNGNFAPGLGRGNSQGNGTTFRGQPYNGTFRNGLRLQFGFATENVDRIEIAKGPMAVFVGGATLGGEVNVVTKQPLFDTKREFYFEGGSHDTYHAALDLTGPLTRTLAYRLITDYKDGNTWRDYSHSRTIFESAALVAAIAAFFDAARRIHS